MRQHSNGSSLAVAGPPPVRGVPDLGRWKCAARVRTVERRVVLSEKSTHSVPKDRFFFLKQNQKIDINDLRYATEEVAAKKRRGIQT